MHIAQYQNLEFMHIAKTVQYTVHTDVTVQCTCTSWAEGSNPAPPSMIPGALQDHCEILQNLNFRVEGETST